MAYTDIDDPSAHFQAVLYTGTGSTQSITNDGNSDLKPDWVWVKKRDGTESHALSDSTRGTSATLFSNTTAAESSSGQGINSFNTDGFQVGTEGIVNDSGNAFVGWQWKANGGTTSSNTDGSITSTVQANTTAGFSIVTYTGTGSAATVGHGLGATPDMIIVKNRDTAVDWAVWHQNLTDAGYVLALNVTDAQVDSGTNRWNHTDPTSSVFSVGSGQQTNQSSNNMVAYCFAEKKGYSKFGVYTSSNLGDVSGGRVRGKYVHTGFKPAFVMIKVITTSGNWQIYHHKIPTYGNEIDLKLGANRDAAENGSDLGNTSQNNLDFYANGFRCTTRNTDTNTGTNEYVYMAFAENPFVTSTGIPTTAR